MILLILWIAVVMGLLAHLEKPDRDENIRVKQMIREARYHERHPEPKRSTRYMNAGYFG